MIQPCPVLDAAGLPGPDLALAHGIQLSETDMTLMVEHGVALAVTPISELRLELRMPPLTELRRHGITIGLGFDDPAFAGSMDMFATMRVALGLERTRQDRADAVSPQDVLRMATIDGARYLGMDDVTGSLTPGKRADIILVRRDDLNMAPAGGPRAALVFSARPSNVDTVIVRSSTRRGPALRRVCERAGQVGLLVS